MRTILRLLTAALVGNLLAGCAPRSNDSGSSAQQHEEPSEAHWVHSQGLQDIMRELDRESRALWPQEIDDTDADAMSSSAQHAFIRASLLASRLASASQGIPTVVADMDMPEADRRAFQAQVDTLAEQARRVEASSRDRDLPRLRRQLTHLETTCQSCHQRFRDYAGEWRSDEPFVE